MYFHCRENKSTEVLRKIKKTHYFLPTALLVNYCCYICGMYFFLYKNGIIPTDTKIRNFTDCVILMKYPKMCQTLEKTAKIVSYFFLDNRS